MHLENYRSPNSPTDFTDEAKKYEPRRLLSLDIDDHIDPTTREWITVDEDGNMVFPEAHEQQAAALGAKFEAWLLGQDGLTLEQERWLRTIGSQIKANAGSWEEFTAGHLAFHPFTLMGGLPQAIRVFGGDDAIDDLLAGLNAAVFGDKVGTGGTANDQPHAPH